MQSLIRPLEDEVLPMLRRGQARMAPGADSLGVQDAPYLEAYPYSGHRHNHYQWCWLLSGRATMKVEERVYELHPGDMCLLSPNYEHTDVYTDATPAYQSLWFSHHLSTLHVYIYDYQPGGLWKVLHSTLIDCPSQIAGLLTVLQSESEKENLYSIDVCRAVQLQLAVLLARSLREASEAIQFKPPPGYVARRVLHYLEEFYADDVSLASVARVACLSPNYLASVFKQETGQTIFEALADVRLRHATRLLMEGQAVRNVARAVGYNDLSHFSHTFRRKLGVSPGRYGKCSDS
jgi:AraC-like DNA-binding protein